LWIKSNHIFKGKQLIHTIILADDHILVRQGIRRIIEEDSSLKVIGEAADGQEVLELLKESTSNLVILDISMPQMGGFEAAAIIKNQYPAVKIIMLTMFKRKNFLTRAMEMGVDGFVLKEEADADLNSAIKAVLENNFYFSPLLK
jgi:DNA-binding NarL/FixJ family response regulator